MEVLDLIIGQGLVLKFLHALILILLCKTFSAASSTDITEGPVSVTALVGTNAQFHCAGTGNLLTWIVDGSPHYYQTIVDRGITAVTVLGSGTIQSNLTVPATSVNNGTTVQCTISLSIGSPLAISNYSILTVLKGIGPVLNLRFSPSFSTIMWDPPSTAGVLNGLTYHLTVTNMNTGVVIINTTTTDNNHLVSSIQYCTFYNASVGAFSFEHTGDTVSITDKTPGGYYHIFGASVDVFINSGVVGIILRMHLQLTGLPCPKQKVKIQPYCSLQSSVCDNITNLNASSTGHEVMIQQSGVITYSITDGIENKIFLYTAAISVFGNEGAVQALTLTFSTFEVQHCDVHTNHTSYILVECTFAINSTAPGFVLIQDEHSQYTINTTLQRHVGDVGKGSVNITDLPTGEYKVTVYDEMEESSMEDMFAYTYPKSLQISQMHNLRPSATSSVSSVHQSGSSLIASVSTESPSITPTTTPHPPSSLVGVVPVVIGVVSVVVVIIVVIVVVVIVCLLIVCKSPVAHVHLKQPTIQNSYIERKDLKVNIRHDTVYLIT